MTTEELVKALNEALGPGLKSVVLFGSAAAGDFVKGVSGHDVLIVADKLGAAELAALSAPLARWRQAGNPQPQLFTAAELAGSADVFPIEFMQMEKARKILFGRDPFEFVKISRANLRHQTEYELRTGLIRLRRLYIPASTSAERLANLMTDSLGSFAALFRAFLILQGQEPPVSKQETIDAITQLLGLDATPFPRILALHNDGAATLTIDQANSLFASYMVQIEKVIEAVDRIE